MKYVIFILLMLMTTILTAQQYPLAEDVSSIAGLMKASYEVVSGLKGEKRQWERDRSLHHAQAIYSYKNAAGKQVTIPLSEFHQDTDAMVMETDFFESEVTREVRVFGNIAHVWSTYETRLKKDGPVERRGINSVQLIYEHNRWWILSWTFSGETAGNSIPASFDRN